MTTTVFDSLDKNYVISAKLEELSWGKRGWFAIYKTIARDDDGVAWFMHLDEMQGDTSVLEEAQACVSGVVEENGCYEMVTCLYDSLPCGENIGDVVSFGMALVEAYRRACQLLGVKEANVLGLDQWNRCIDQFREMTK